MLRQTARVGNGSLAAWRGSAQPWAPWRRGGRRETVMSGAAGVAWRVLRVTSARYGTRCCLSLRARALHDATCSLRALRTAMESFKHCCAYCGILVSVAAVMVTRCATLLSALWWCGDGY